jgi:high-affinity Fe2+/Pb2+ permease
MNLSDFHGILFNMQILYSAILGVYGAWLAAQAGNPAAPAKNDSSDDELVSGNYWGAVVIYILLNIAILIVGILLLMSGYTIASENRIVIYFLYMAFLIVIMPGLYSMLRGRDDRRAAIYFSVLAFFNAAVSFSMVDRGLAIWVLQ